MCKECDDAQKQYEKDQIKHAKEKQNAEMMKSLANPGAPKPRGAPPAAAPAAAAPAAGSKPAAPAPAAAKPADDAPLEFTPAAKPSAADDIPPTIEYKPEPKKK
jgi:hypothetical protein